MKHNVAIFGSARSLVPWLALLGLLLFVPSNQTTRAWWVWVPVVALTGILRVATSLNAVEQVDAVAVFADMPIALVFGLAALWLLWPQVTRRSRWFTFLLTCLVLECSAVGAFAISFAWSGDLPVGIVLFIVIAGCALMLAAAINLAGRLCRQRYSGGRFSAWVLLWLIAGGLLTGAIIVTIALVVDDVPWPQIVVVPLVMGGFGLVVFALFLCFMILARLQPFYGARLEAFAAIGRVLDAEPSAPPLPVADVQDAGPPSAPPTAAPGTQTA